ncbi:hypothetical protein GQ43DRAFT_431606 [Delitschia confertaspora ATCC 74209]|uniref:Uncharacterized protein n=1 Tax=Delitschia confertaspora ATCC 74209 TaxID=1513339 RepID=A0A9P4MSX9_9PLEO|nr:hypothetical protein GQ43DRAFT_431606 [Delitschia confertaspora ATCC 74209]
MEKRVGKEKYWERQMQERRIEREKERILSEENNRPERYYRPEPRACQTNDGIQPTSSSTRKPPTGSSNLGSHAPFYKRQYYTEDYSTGIASPSDPRRPQENKKEAEKTESGSKISLSGNNSNADKQVPAGKEESLDLTATPEQKSSSSEKVSQSENISGRPMDNIERDSLSAAKAAKPHSSIGTSNDLNSATSSRTNSSYGDIRLDWKKTTMNRRASPVEEDTDWRQTALDRKSSTYKYILSPNEAAWNGLMGTAPSTGDQRIIREFYSSMLSGIRDWQKSERALTPQKEDLFGMKERQDRKVEEKKNRRFDMPKDDPYFGCAPPQRGENTNRAVSAAQCQDPHTSNQQIKHTGEYAKEIKPIDKDNEGWPIWPGKSSEWKPQAKRLLCPVEQAGTETNVSLHQPSMDQPRDIHDAIISLSTNDSSSKGTGANEIAGIAPASPAARRSTSDVLKQLPENDIDLITAEEIRARMGSKMNSQKHTEKKEKTRKELEQDFATAHTSQYALHPTLASGVLNEQHIRRTERELNQNCQGRTLETSLDHIKARWKKGRLRQVEVNPSASEDASETSLASEQDTMAIRKLEEKTLPQRAAMQEFSDNGYSESPKPIPAHISKQTLKERDPLENSLFRPFEHHLTNLGKDVGAVEKDLIKADKEVDAVAEKKHQFEDGQALVKELRQAYEDVYGPITVHHRQVLVNENRANADRKVIKEENLNSPANNDKAEQIERKKEKDRQSEKTTAPTKETVPYASQESSTKSQAAGSPPLIDQTSTTKSSTEAYSDAYKILAYDPVMRSVRETTSSPPNTESPSITIAEALSRLQHPAEFLPHLPDQFIAVTAGPKLLIIRESKAKMEEKETLLEELNGTVKISASEGELAEESGGDSGTVATATATPPKAGDHPPTAAKEEGGSTTATKKEPGSPAPMAATEQEESPRYYMNPIDGTTHPVPSPVTGNFASPTGFVNYDDLARQLSRERLAKISEGRKMHETEMSRKEARMSKDMERRAKVVKWEEVERKRKMEEEKTGRTKRRLGSVVRIAAYGMAGVYVVGVLAEVGGW